MTAGIAATSPIAVASSASAMPGATTARLVVCDFEMPIKLFMMPQTVPNNPTKGEVAPIVARKLMPIRMRRASARTISAKLDAARSLMPLSLEIPADSRASRIAALSSDDSTLSLAPSASWASASERESAILFRTRRILRCAIASSIIFAMKIVQVTSEAKASPIMTALTTISADKNIDQGENSRIVTAVDFSDLGAFSAVASAGGTAPCGADATGAGTCAAGGKAGGRAGSGDRTGGWLATGACCGAAGFCCANAAGPDDITVSATSRLRNVLNITAYSPARSRIGWWLGR